MKGTDPTSLRSGEIDSVPALITHQEIEVWECKEELERSQL